MGRSESKQAYNDSRAAQQQMTAQAQQALSQANTAVSGYNDNVHNFLNVGRSNYAPGGEYDRENTLLGTSVASGGAESSADQLNNFDKRTGNMNSGQSAAAAEEIARSNQRQLTDFLASADKDRMDRQTAVEQFGVQASALPADVYSRIYGTATGGSLSALGNETSAAQTPGFWDTFLPALIGGGATVAAGFAGVPRPKDGGCWIAEAIYGPDDPRTHLVREWLNVEFALHPLGRYVMKAYLRFGRRVAVLVRKNKLAQLLFRPFFDRALSSAIQWKAASFAQDHS